MAKRKKDNDYTIFLLVAAGLGIYWLLRKQTMPPATTSPVQPSDQSNIQTTTDTNAYNVNYVINGMRKFGKVPNTI
jgi:hypothetical protein